MLRLEPDNPLPLHYQLTQQLRAQITSGRWRAGEAIPSERDLTQRLAVSRATVRQALHALITAGLLERRRGRGTFVVQPKIEQEMRAVYSFYEQLQALGRPLRDRLLQRVRVPASPELAAKLAVEPGEPLVQIQRLRYVDETPLTLDSSFIPLRLCPELLEVELTGSLYRLLTERFDLPPLHSTDTLETLPADRATAAHLQIAPGEPLLYVERVAYTHNDLPLQVGRNYIRGDRCRFRMNLWSGIELKPD